MKRLALFALVFSVSLGSFCYGYQWGYEDGAGRGYVVGLFDGAEVGILTCPCWSR